MSLIETIDGVDDLSDWSVAHCVDIDNRLTLRNEKDDASIHIKPFSTVHVTTTEIPDRFKADCKFNFLVFMSFLCIIFLIFSWRFIHTCAVENGGGGSNQNFPDVTYVTTYAYVV